MELIDDFLFFLGTPNQYLDFGVFLQEVNRAYDGIYRLMGQRTAPDINTIAIHRHGIFEIAVIHYVLDMGEFGMGTAFGSVDYDVSG